MTAHIVVNIPGAKLLSSRSSGNNRLHPHARAREARTHRTGANLHVARALADLPGYRMASTVVRGRVVWQPACGPVGGFSARSVTLGRLCPARYFCDQDNLRALFKATLDGLADALGVNDKVFEVNPTEEQIKAGKIGINYEQIDGDWGVRITIELT